MCYVADRVFENQMTDENIFYLNFIAWWYGTK